jgi:hypothetical protein
MSTIHQCPECTQPIRDLDTRRSLATCPSCGARLVSGDQSRWINVARVQNLAEAGFLADELSGDGIEARIYQAEDFSAMTDRWSVSYLIQARPREAQAAAARVRQHLADREAYPEPAPFPQWDDRPAIDATLWRPVALVVLAGMVSFVIGQKFGADRDSARPPRNSLSRAVTSIGRPLVTEPAPGQSRHRLRYADRERTWYLETDADLDGAYERTQRFPAGAAGW